MSFLSVLGKFAAPIAGIAAAPFTGGASLIPSLIGAGGSALSAASGAMASNRGNQAQFDLASQDAFERELMAREANKRTNRNDALRQSVFASMLSGYHPAERPAGMPQSFSGLGQPGSDALGFTASDALARLKAADQLPQLTRATMPKAGAWEKILGIAGPAMATYGALAGMGDNDSSSAAGPLSGTRGVPLTAGAGQFSYGLALPPALTARQTVSPFGMLFPSYRG